MSLFFPQAHSLKAALKKFGKKGKKGARKEVNQPNDRTAYKPSHPSDLMTDEKRKSIERLNFLSEKRDNSTKGPLRTN